MDETVVMLLYVGGSAGTTWRCLRRAQDHEE